MSGDQVVVDEELHSYRRESRVGELEAVRSTRYLVAAGVGRYIEGEGCLSGREDFDLIANVGEPDAIDVVAERTRLGTLAENLIENGPVSARDGLEVGDVDRE